MRRAQALVGELAGLIEVEAVDDAGHVDRLEADEAARAAPGWRLDDDRVNGSIARTIIAARLERVCQSSQFSAVWSSTGSFTRS